MTTSKRQRMKGAALRLEAKRIARLMVKDAIKEQGGMLSHYKASEIDKAARALLKYDNTNLIRRAKRNLKGYR